jgi:hypothetical protein
MLGELPETDASARRLDDVIARAGQHVAQHRQKLGVVLDDEDARLRADRGKLRRCIV